MHLYIRVAFRVQQFENYPCARIVERTKNVLRMNKTKLKVYKKVLHEVCKNFDEEFMNQKIEEICFQKKLYVKEVTYFVY